MTAFAVSYEKQFPNHGSIATDCYVYTTAAHAMCNVVDTRTQLLQRVIIYVHNV